jgi:tetratricopeptide (TPR) repeat protein
VAWSNGFFCLLSVLTWAAAAPPQSTPARATPETEAAIRRQLDAIESELKELGAVGPSGLETLERLHKRHPERTDIASLLRKAYGQRNDWKALIQLVSERPPPQRNGQDWRDLATWLLIDGQYQAAAEILEHLVAANPNLADVVGLLGRALFYRGEYARAAPLLEKAMKELSGLDRAEASTLRALIHWYGRELPQAEALLRATTREEPDYDPASNALGRVLAAKGQTQEAREWFDRATQIRDKRAAEKRRRLALSSQSQEASRAFQEGRYDDCERLLAAMLPLSDPAQKIRIYRYLAEVRKAAGRPGDAQAAVREAEKLEREKAPQP